MIQALFRYIATTLCLNEYTYLLGMVFVRISRLLRKSIFKPNGLEEFKVVKFMGSIFMKVNINSYMGGSIYWTGFHQLNELLFLKHNLKDKMVFFDIGANQGEFTLFAASLVKNGKVMAFEPVNKIRNQLMENIRLNNYENVAVYEYGLSNENAKIPIYTSLEQNQYSGLNEGLSSLYKTEERSHIEQYVDIRIFDDQFDGSLTQVDIVKIDIEGAELFALQGMVRCLTKFKPIILIEINEETFKAAGYTTQDLISFSKSLGYSIYKIKRGRAVQINDSEIEFYGNYILKS